MNVEDQSQTCSSSLSRLNGRVCGCRNTIHCFGALTNPHAVHKIGYCHILYSPYSSSNTLMWVRDQEIWEVKTLVSQSKCFSRLRNQLSLLVCKFLTPFSILLRFFYSLPYKTEDKLYLLTIWLNLALFWLFGIFKDPVAMAIRTVKPDFAVPVDTARPFVNVNWRLVSVASFLMGGSSTLSISCVRATSAWSAGSRTQTKSATLRPTKKTTVSIGPTARKWRFLNKYRHS